MNRRNFLKVFGVMAAAPSLLVKQAVLTPRVDPQIITTGFKALDAAMSGQGLQRGEMLSFVGTSGVGKSSITKTVALNTSKQATVALLQNQISTIGNGCEENCNGNLSIFEHVDYKNGQVIESIFENHDVVIIHCDFAPIDSINFIRNTYPLLEKYKTRLILSLNSVKPIFDNNVICAKYMSSYMVGIHPLKETNIGILDRMELKPTPRPWFAPVRSLQVYKNRHNDKFLWSPIWLKSNATFTDEYFDFEKTQQKHPHVSSFNYEDQSYSDQRSNPAAYYQDANQRRLGLG